ncbi:MAG: hypothetical protein ABI144_03305 [Gallionella sp.]
MNEEQAILDFFSQPENLQLALSVAEQMDKLRTQMNNRFWRELMSRLTTLINEQELAWHIDLTEDKNAPDSLVGLHCVLPTERQIYLRPMMEQQYLGGEWRVYFGLAWSVAPAPDQLGSVMVSGLKASLQKSGFKSNESFLAWQWTAFRPRGKDFLLNYARHPEKSLDDAVKKFGTLLVDHRELIERANEVLMTTPSRSLSVALNQLRDELLD